MLWSWGSRVFPQQGKGSSGQGLRVSAWPKGLERLTPASVSTDGCLSSADISISLLLPEISSSMLDIIQDPQNVFLFHIWVDIGEGMEERLKEEGRDCFVPQAWNKDDDRQHQVQINV